MFRLLFIAFSVAVVCSFVSFKSVALEVNDLYQVLVKVEDQTSVKRKEAITTALRGVFLKVGGKSSVLEHKLLSNAIKKPNQYINQYRYQRNNDELSILVKFNEDKINQLFTQADLPLWGSLRPQVLIWLLDEQGASRHIVAYDEISDFPEVVNEFSKQRGLPILLPLMDLTDSEQIFLSDFWAYFPERVQEASQRYFADTVIVMRVSDSSLVNEADKKSAEEHNHQACDIPCVAKEIKTAKALDWRLYTQGTLYIQRYKGNDKTQLITQGLSDISELIYQTYALSTTADNDFVIEVNNVTSLKSDMQLFDFLKDLSGVNTVTLISAQADVRRFQLDLTSSRTSFLASLRLNDKLTQQLEPNADNYNTELEGNYIGSESEFFNMKVVVLGEEVTENTGEQIETVNLPLESNTSVMPDGMQVNNIEPSSEALDDENTPGLTSDAEEPAALPITPSVPVFYWEKG